MQGINKLVGAFLGFLLGGPSGFLLGLLIGHALDKNFITISSSYHFDEARHQQFAEKIFFESTFLVMGYIAQLDGRVSESTIERARTVMDTLYLNANQKRQAILLFNQGKKAQFSLQSVLDRLVIACRSTPSLLQHFVRIQQQVASHDAKSLSKEKERVLTQLYRVLKMNRFQFNEFESLFDNYFHQNSDTQYRQNHQNRYTYQNQSSDRFKKACETLGISPEATHEEVKKAYRRLRGKYHPDRLSSQTHLSTQALKNAREKLHLLQKAYDTVCRTKNFI